MMSINASITSESDFESTPNGLAAKWQTEIQASQQELLKFHQDANRITQRFLDKRDIGPRQQSFLCNPHSGWNRSLRTV